MSYYDFRRQKIKENGSNDLNGKLARSRDFLIKNFSNHPSYKLGKIKKKNVDSKDIDIRVVNIDQTVTKKRLHFLPTEDISEGDYVCYDNKCFILMEVETNAVDIYSLAFECEQTLNYQGLGKPIPCYVTNSSYGDKGVVYSTYLIEGEGKILIYVQYNEYTRRLKQDMRFIFDNDEDSVYKIIKLNRVTTGNVLTIVVEKDKYNAETDDLENNIAYNAWLDVEVPTIPTGELSVFGDSEISKYDTGIYTVMDEDGVANVDTWDISIDYNGNDTGVVAETDRGNNHIKIKNNGYMGLDIKLIFTLGDVEIIKEVRLVR